MPERQQEYVKRMKERGFVKIAVWCHPSDTEAIKLVAKVSRQSHDPAKGS